MSANAGRKPRGRAAARVRADEALRESEERLRVTIQNSQAIVFGQDCDLRITWVANPAYGFTPEDLIGKTDADLMLPEEAAVTAAIKRRVMESGASVREQVRITFGGEGYWFDLAVEPIRGPAGDITGVSCVSVDITGLKRAEGALRASEDKYRSIVETSREWIWSVDLDGYFTYCNEAVRAILGYEPEELIGVDSAGLLHPDDRVRIEAMMTRWIGAKEGWTGIVARTRCKDGTYRHLESNGTPVLDGAGDVIGYRGADRDVTARIIAEEALRESEERHRELVENINDIIFALDASGAVTYISPVVEQLGGYAPAEIIGRPFTHFIHPDDVPDLAQSFQRVVSGNPEPSEYRMLSRSGEVRWVRSSSRPIIQDGRVAGLRGVLNDITERKLVEEALNKETEFTDTAINSLPGMFYVFDDAGRFVRWNRRLEEVSGYSAAEIARMSPLDFIAEKDRQTVATRILEVFTAGRSEADGHFLTKGGEEIPYLFTGVRFQSDGHNYLAGMGLDIIERRRADEALRESEERYRLILDNVQEVIYRVTLSNDPFHAEVMFVGGQVEKVLGYSAGEFVADQGLWGRILHPDDVPAVKESAARLAAGESLTRQYRLRHKVTGEYRWMEDRAVPLVDDSGKVIGQQGVARDITERRKAEDALRESEERFSKAFHSSSTAIVISTLDDGRIIDINERTLAMFGYTRSEALGRTTSELGAWVDLEDRTNMVRTLREQGHVRDAEYRLRTRHGEMLDVLMSVEPIELRGEPCMLAMFYDVTERKRAEEALRESEERFRNLVETAVDVVFTLAADATLSSLNPAFETVTGWRRDQWLGKPFAPIIHPDDLPRAVDIFRRILIGETPLVYELRVLASDGDYIVAEFHNSPLVLHGAIVGSLGIARDITERKRQEEERNRLLGELERLAHRLLRIQEEERRQVAYDIHDGPAQQMVAADMYLESYKAARETAGNEDAEGYLERATSFLSSAIKDTRRIMSGLRPSVLDDLGLVPALRQYLEETGERTDRKITFSGKIGDERLDPALEIAIFRITQEAVTNAIKHSGTGRIGVSLKKPGALVSLEVRDWGAGFDEEEINREGNGGDHGMGLVSMRERAELLGGRFEIESAPGFGTIIRVTIPVSERL